ncbi:hypothetical protein BH10ACT8_BH10ACT8_07570 [soil metagenome]
MLYRPSDHRNDDPWYRRWFDKLGERWPRSTTLAVATALIALSALTIYAIVTHKSTMCACGALTP